MNSLSSPRTRTAAAWRCSSLFFMVGGLCLAFLCAAGAQTVQPLPTASVAPAVMDMSAYVLTRTPVVEVSLNTDPAGTAARHLVAEGGVCPAVTLLPAPASQSQASRAAAGSTPAANPQPVARVTLTYAIPSTEQVVWVQMAQSRGTLSATDEAGKVYSGERGFFLTLSATGQAMFTYQPPNVSSTYQLLTRFDNVTTVLRFRVPDAAP